MASKKNTTKKKVARKAQASVRLEDRLCDVSLTIAADEGWAAVSLDRLATELRIPLSRVIAVCPTRTSLLSFLFKRVDNVVLNQVGSIDRSESVRDRIFDVLMMRFDALQENRAGYVSLINHLMRRPAALLFRTPSTLHAMALILIAAGVSADGLIGAARAHALAGAYASVVGVWLKDDSSDMSQTMSALDKALGRLEKLVKMASFKPPSRQKKTEQNSD